MKFKKVHNVNELPGGSYFLYGAGGYGSFVFDIIKEQRTDIDVLGFLDDYRKDEFRGVKVLSTNNIPESDAILLTTSYWKDIVESGNLNGIEGEVYVAEFLSGKSNIEILEKVVEGYSFKWYTPNNYLYQISNNFDLIEPNMIDWINRFEKGAKFYDIGASNGVYSIYAGIVAQASVVAFEPDVQNFSIMDHNHYLNHESMGDFLGINMGLGSASEVLTLYCQEYLAGTHGKVFSMGARIAQKEIQNEFKRSVIVESLDRVTEAYKLEVPSYVKIDVDGAELHILKGAEQILYSGRVREIMIEIEEQNVNEIRDYLTNFNYSLHNEYEINEVILTPISGIKNYLFKYSK